MKKSYPDIVYLDSSDTLKKALLRAKEHIKFIPCSDISLIKLEQIDKENSFSSKREIARVCKKLLTIKTSENQRKWRIAITPEIQALLTKKTHELIDLLYKNADKVSQNNINKNLSKVEFHKYVGNLVETAITTLPSTKSEFKLLYIQIWETREHHKNNLPIKEKELKNTKNNTKVILPPGAGISKIIEFLYTTKVKERVFDPIIADMHVEYFDALDNNQKWKMRWIHLRGIINLIIAGISKSLFSYFKDILAIINTN